MASDKRYWKHVEELDPKSDLTEKLAQNEFQEPIPVDDFLGDKENLEESSTTRRDFLKYLGFSTAAATMAACEGPVHKAVPYLVQPDNIVPGVANYYATAIANGYDFASILVKTREGRPIKVENNDRAKSMGDANARVNASVLSLYDSKRLQGPMMKDGDGYSSASWTELNTRIKGGLNAVKNAGKKTVLLTQTYASPSTKALIDGFSAHFGNVEHVVYDAIAEDAALNAFQKAYGERALADYDFSQADLVVSFAADFLADWQGGGFDAGYAQKRVPKNGKMSRHVHLESNMSLTGSNADWRVPLKPSELKVVLAKVYGILSGTRVSGGASNTDEMANGIAQEIRKAGRNAVVVCGLSDENAQSVTLALNKLIESRAFHPETPRYIRQGNSAAVNRLVADMNAGRVGALIMDGVNPVYTLPNGEEFAQGLAQVTLSVDFAYNNDETAQASNYVAATSHNLESWGDVELKKGHFALMQPVIRELFDTRQLQSCLLDWMGAGGTYHDFVKNYWATNILGGASWEKTLQDGYFHRVNPVEVDDSNVTMAPIASASEEDGEAMVQTDVSAALRALSSATSEGMELMLYSKVGMGDGKQANNPWLQEFPDPISRVTWDNYVTISKADADEMGIENYNVANGGLNGSYASVSVNGVTLEKVPVLIQPGQAAKTLGLSFGYGRKAGMQSEMVNGVNAFKLYGGFNNVQSASITKTGGDHEFACLQLQNTLMGRGDIIKETTLADFNSKPHGEWNPVPVVSLDHNEVPATTVDLWESFDRSLGHYFNLSIDLNACTGCGACVIACHAENNVPVVGKAEVRKSRDMHWLRIDRYYSSEDTFAQDVQVKNEAPEGYRTTMIQLEDPAANPQVAFQPIMCQHCNHAPCETVCPVAATSHGRQGQNHMAYNRCVGTRYCANNCPYKVRRFNWFLYNDNNEFNFNMNNDLGKMVLNPDVNVRSRGVMEKCSMCMQMTQKTILDAKKAGKPVANNAFETACSLACSSGAMVFGDINNKNDKVASLKDDDRAYHLLEHVGTQPNVVYQVKVRNTN